MPKFLRILPIFLLLAVVVSGCSILYPRDRCFLDSTRYEAMKGIFEATGSYQRTAQAMKDEGWAYCEVNAFRYRLRKDLELDGPEFDSLFIEEEPERRSLGFYPGRV